MRYMYDAVTASNIPRDAEMVAGYADTITIPQWTQNDWNLFPNAIKVSIVKKASSNWGDVLDVEPGDATPDDAPGWVVMRRRTGSDPTVYCNLSTWPTVQAAFRNRGIPEPWYWIAKYDGDPTIPESWLNQRCVAKQYHGNDPAGFDKSVVVDYWPGVDHKTFIIGDFEEDTYMNGYATTSEKMLAIPCNGKKSLFILTGGKGTVDGHVYYIGDTPPGNAGNYLGDRTIHIDPDRPGPIPLPDNVRGITLFYTATADFTAWCA